MYEIKNKEELGEPEPVLGWSGPRRLHLLHRPRRVVSQGYRMAGLWGALRIQMIISLKEGFLKWHLSECCLLPAVHSWVGNAPYQGKILSAVRKFLKSQKGCCVAGLSKSLSLSLLDMILYRIDSIFKNVRWHPTFPLLSGALWVSSEVQPWVRRSKSDFTGPNCLNSHFISFQNW